MSGERVYVAGTRTFAAEVVDFAVDAGLEPAGLLEPIDPERIGTTIHDLEVLAIEGPHAGSAPVLIGTGEPDRREIAEQLRAAGWKLATLIHPTAHVAPTAAVGDAAIVGPAVVVGARSRVGSGAVLGRGALVGHHTEIGELATLNPGANVAGNVRVGTGALIGMSAAVRDHTTVGDWATVAMGAVVVADVPPRTLVRGVPARAVEPGD